MSLAKTIYKKYFDKDKFLRHYFQHLMIALSGYLGFMLITEKKFDWISVIFLILGTYLIDLDGLLVILTGRDFEDYRKEAGRIYNKKGINEMFNYLAKNHKQIDKLYLHNFLFFLISLILMFITKGNLQIFFLTINLHFCFDILDDFAQLNNCKNWFWVFRK